MGQSKKKMGLSTQILLGLVIGALFGYFFPEIGAKMKPLGDAFVRMIKMIVVPLIFSTLVIGIAGTGDFKKLGRLGGKAIIWFEAATTVALAVGLIVVNFVQPGIGVDMPIPADASAQAAATAKKTIDMGEYLLHIIPTNIVDACARNDMLQIIFFTCFFGVGVAHIGKDGETIVNMCRSIAETMFKVTHYVMKLAPIGIFAMISYTVGSFGVAMLIPLGKLILSLVGAAIIFLAILLTCASLITGINFLHVVTGVKEALLLAFSTASSEAALPIAMQRLEQLGVPKNIVTFVMPTGYSFNLDGSTLYSSLTVIFIAQIYGIELSLGEQLLMMLTLMLSTKGIAGVPGAGFIVVAATATAFGLPADGVAIVLGVDRILDMIRTFCNVFGNCVATVVVAHWEKDLTKESFNEAYQKNFNS
ncbi:proton glutamate symport protein [Propionispira arboris]|jgi:proton glutamate symport protein|uniref:Proton glutamate symport protein n=1 Tax=Propionispira arboris TaxID=84035 RepID=A0A1H6UQJ8_9FIRM|nr:cation:dicarboxylase symporter family transporter [Propionispira arboris]SEI94498.1 proton glutamate symport protein [Propionispira arboris]